MTGYSSIAIDLRRILYAFFDRDVRNLIGVFDPHFTELSPYLAAKKHVRLNKSNLRLLENKIKRLEGIIEILQNSKCTAKAPLNEKLTALEQMYSKDSVYMTFYIEKRPHAKNGYKTPKKKETEYHKRNK